MTIHLPQHAPITQFDVAEDCLLVGDQKITELARQAGRTPFYAYDKSVMAEKVTSLRQAFPADIQLHYAVKANPNQEVVNYLASRVNGLDVASAGELKVALRSGMSASAISFAGPGKTSTELAAAIDAGIVINIESARELELITRHAEQHRQQAQVAIRVNPDFELKTSGMKMAGGPKQFGIDAEQVPDILQNIGNTSLDFRGFHIFSGSQNLRADAICESQLKTLELAIELAGFAPSPVRTLNIGGGLGIPYFPGDQPLDLQPIGKNLENLLEITAQKLPGCELIMELGRFLVGEAGIYVCRVLDRKISRGRVFLVTDGGLHHHLAASGNFGQVIRKNYPVVVGNKVCGKDRENASVVGPLCTPLDLLADRMEMAKAESGDFIAVFQSGAYGLTASPTAFLSHPPPVEIVV